MNVRLASMLVLASMMAACGGSTPSSPTPPEPPTASSPAGNWSGTIRDPVAGEGAMQLSLADQSGLLGGSWSATFKSGEKVSGRSVATVVQGRYGIVLSADPTPPCASGQSGLLGYALINVVVTSQRLTAVLSRTSCSGPAFGTVDLSKQ